MTRPLNPILAVLFLAFFTVLAILPGQTHHHFAPAAYVKDETGLFCDGCEAPGVAFSLRPDYGTVAVKLKDRRPVPLARVNGTETYKDLARTTSAPVSSDDLKLHTWCNIYHSIVPRSIRHFFNCCPKDSYVDAVEDLLYNLKAAAEAYLGHNICLVNIDLLQPLEQHLTQSRFRQTIDTVLSNLGLTQAVDFKMNAYSMALQSEGFLEIYGRPGQPESDLVLVIEADHSGLISLDLPLLDEIGVNSIRQDYNVTGSSIPSDCLGEDIPTSCIASSLQRQEVIRQALANITTPPYGELPWAQDISAKISKIMVYGDAADDAVLHEELLALFGPELATGSVAKQPVYASAMGGAKLAFYKINHVSYFDYTSAWCCWRSWGRACPNNPQRIDI